MRSPNPTCPAPDRRMTRSRTGWQGRCCCSVNGTVRSHTPSRTSSDDAVREGNVVLIDDARFVAPSADPPAAGPVRRVGESVLLLGTREAPKAPEPAPLRLSKFHAPEIVFGSDSVQELSLIHI